MMLEITLSFCQQTYKIMKPIKFFINISSTCLRFDKLDTIQKSIPDFEKQVREAIKTNNLPKLLITEELLFNNIMKEIASKQKLPETHSILVLPIYLDFDSSTKIRIKPIALIGTAENINDYVKEQIERLKMEKKLKGR
jgi:hypothetical protein